MVEKAEISFGAGLNILTGETGSGKSAILSAIRLISGERADAGCIRKGADFAVVEAVFEGPVFVRREIHRSGKNRCFIDDQQVTLAVLREAVNIEMVDQSSSQTIFEQQRKMLDTFAGLLTEVREFEKSFEEEKSLEKELQVLLQTPKERELEWALKDLALIEEVGLQKGEEERLGEEHHFLTHAQELMEKVSGVAFALTEGTDLPSMKRILSTLEHCIRFDSKLAPMAQAMKNGILELEEVGRSVQSYAEKLEADPQRLAIVEKRIAAIESLKRRFGSDVEAEREKLKAKVDSLTHLDAQIEELRVLMEKIKAKNSSWAKSLTDKRKKTALPFSTQVLDELKSLNIPHAKFEIVVGENFGEIRYLFSANPGVPPVPLEECASGGELSRLLLAIKTILADGNSTLVFDEIDSNVGGQTAAILGQKLQRLAKKRQVICVTHFVQVAKCAMDHFLVSKKEKNGIALTIIKKISDQEREIEYNRMLGNN